MQTAARTVLSTPTPPPVVADPRAAQILARTLYKDMMQNGLCPEQILAIASELIDRVTQELRQPPKTSGRA